MAERDRYEYAQVARAFHVAYEKLAPEHGYETREDTRIAWEALRDNHRALMIHVVKQLEDDGVISLS